MQFEFSDNYIKPEMKDGIDLIYFNEKLEKGTINIPENIIYKNKIIYNYENGIIIDLILYLNILDEDILNQILEIYTLDEVKIKLTLHDYCYIVNGKINDLQILALKERTKSIIARRNIGYNKYNPIFAIDSDIEIEVKDCGYCCEECQKYLLATLGYTLS